MQNKAINKSIRMKYIFTGVRVCTMSVVVCVIKLYTYTEVRGSRPYESCVICRFGLPAQVVTRALQSCNWNFTAVCVVASWASLEAPLNCVNMLDSCVQEACSRATSSLRRAHDGQ